MGNSFEETWKVILRFKHRGSRQSQQHKPSVYPKCFVRLFHFMQRLFYVNLHANKLYLHHVFQQFTHTNASYRHFYKINNSDRNNLGIIFSLYQTILNHRSDTSSFSYNISAIIITRYYLLLGLSIMYTTKAKLFSDFSNLW